MKRTWRIRRQTSPNLDGLKRWDRAYQLLIQWGQVNPPLLSGSALTPEVPNDHHQSRCICESLDSESDSNPND